MSFLEALILGIIQGLTEFLPVSSSGHIELGKAILGVQVKDPLLFSIVVHGATAFSTVVIFRKVIWDLIREALRLQWNESLQYIFKIGISMVPAGLVGIFLEDQIESFFEGNVMLVGAMLLVTGLLLYLTTRAPETDGSVSFPKSLWVGIAQAIAILPGISRSGATISTALLLGISRERAARFSFLMVVPLIFGAMLIKGKKYYEISSLESMELDARVEVIMDELEKDDLLKGLETEYISHVIMTKERAWDKAKAANADDESGLEAVKAGWQANMERAHIDPLTSEAILAHEFGAIRPLNGIPMLVLLVGFLAAFLTGLLACTWMINLVKKGKLIWFAVYCVIVGIVAMISAGVMSAV